MAISKYTEVYFQRRTYPDLAFVLESWFFGNTLIAVNNFADVVWAQGSLAHSLPCFETIPSQKLLYPPRTLVWHDVLSHDTLEVVSNTIHLTISLDLFCYLEKVSHIPTKLYS